MARYSAAVSENSPHEEQASNVGLVLSGIVGSDPEVEGGGEEGEAGLVEEAPEEVEPGTVVVGRAVFQHHPQPQPHRRPCA